MRYRLNEFTLCIKTDILTTLAYFDIFKYPLTRKEIYVFLQEPCARILFDDCLNELAADKSIYKIGEFYSLHNNGALVNRRQIGNSKAHVLVKKARSIAHILSWFPFVRGVAVSGSLSKNFADDSSDIDFFIITKPGRLWIARTLMHCLKKMSFLANKQHYFCMNYYIDETHLEIQEKNIYTATEIVTLLPLWGATAFERFYAANDWTKKFLPNNFMRISSARFIEGSFLKRFAESMFANQIGNWLDKKLMQVTAKRWKHKTSKRQLNEKGIVLSMATAEHFAKPDPSIYQQKFLSVYKEKVEHVLEKYASLLQHAQ